MHFHLVAALVWRWQHLKAPVADFLGRIAREQLVLVSSGGSDWLESSGSAEPVDGGYRIHARKVFASGCPAGDVLMTSAVLDDPQAGPTVLHFALPLKGEQMKTVSTWQALGMRGTGSHDLLIEGAFVAASAVTVRRPRGRWHPAMHLVAKVALPLIYSAYVGVAEAARDLALREAQDRRSQPLAHLVAGEMENALFAARLAHARMVQIGGESEPGPETTSNVLMARTLLAQSAIRTVEKAIELVGGRSFYRPLGLERLFRDVQAAQFHPVAEKPQQQLVGRLALGLDLDAV
jgi:acyl-CoA dehydrogenase